MISLAHVIKYFRQRSTQWVKISPRLGSLSGWIWIWILILILEGTLVLILFWFDIIDIGLNIGKSFACISKGLFGGCKNLPFVFVNPTIVNSIFDPHSTVA